MQECQERGRGGKVVRPILEEPKMVIMQVKELAVCFQKLSFCRRPHTPLRSPTSSALSARCHQSPDAKILYSCFLQNATTNLTPPIEIASKGSGMPTRQQPYRSRNRFRGCHPILSLATGGRPEPVACDRLNKQICKMAVIFRGCGWCTSKSGQHCGFPDAAGMKTSK